MTTPRFTDDEERELRRKFRKAAVALRLTAKSPRDWEFAKLLWWLGEVNDESSND